MERYRQLTIGLYGIVGLYNYGCEAIIRGTVGMLRTLIPDCRIIYYSYNAEGDRTYISDLDIEVIQIFKGIGLVKRLINRVLRFARIEYRIPYDDYKRMCDDTDVIVSIGGDIYTIPEHIRKNKSYEYYNYLVQFGEYVKRRNKRLVIFGASIGPFGDYNKAKTYYFEHLKKVDLIICREENSFEYLFKNGLQKNTVFYPDPAFFVTAGAKIETNNNEYGYVGINLSPLSLYEMFGSVNLTDKIKLAQLISRISRETTKDILLIPHVVSPSNKADNDLSFLNEILGMIDQDLKPRVRILDDVWGFIQTKQYLRSCDVVVSARMHCAINALCEFIPTIFLSYSEKSKGIARFVYGNENWMLPLDKMETELIDMIKSLLEQRNDIHEYLEGRITGIRNSEQFNENLKRLARLLKEDK